MTYLTVVVGPLACFLFLHFCSGIGTYKRLTCCLSPKFSTEECRSLSNHTKQRPFIHRHQAFPHEHERPPMKFALGYFKTPPPIRNPCSKMKPMIELDRRYSCRYKASISLSLCLSSLYLPSLCLSSGLSLSSQVHHSMYIAVAIIALSSNFGDPGIWTIYTSMGRSWCRGWTWRRASHLISTLSTIEAVVTRVMQRVVLSVLCGWRRNMRRVLTESKLTVGSRWLLMLLRGGIVRWAELRRCSGILLLLLGLHKVACWLRLALVVVTLIQRQIVRRAHRLTDSLGSLWRRGWC